MLKLSSKVGVMLFDEFILRSFINMDFLKLRRMA